MNVRSALPQSLVLVAFALTPLTVAAQGVPKRQIEIVHYGEDAIGEQIAYRLRDNFRSSASFEVVPASGLFRLYITSVDANPRSPNQVSMYAVVLTMQQENAEAFYTQGYITSLVASCGVGQIGACAEDLYNKSAAEAELALEDIADAVNADMQRRFREALGN